MECLYYLFNQGKPDHSCHYHNVICFSSLKMFFTQGGENPCLSFQRPLALLTRVHRRGLATHTTHKAWESSCRTGVGRARGRTDKCIIQILYTITVFHVRLESVPHPPDSGRSRCPVSCFHSIPLPDSSQLFGKTDSITLGPEANTGLQCCLFSLAACAQGALSLGGLRSTREDTLIPGHLGCLPNRCHSAQHGSPIQGIAGGKIQAQLRMSSKKFWLPVDNSGMGITCTYICCKSQTDRHSPLCAHTHILQMPS